MDKLRAYFKKYGNRSHSGFVRDGDSIQWVVDVIEWLSLGHALADELSPSGVDVSLELDVDPLEWAICQQLVRLGKLHEVYDGSRGERSVFFARAEYADKMSMTFGQKASSMMGFPLQVPGDSIKRPEPPDPDTPCPDLSGWSRWFYLDVHYPTPEIVAAMGPDIGNNLATARFWPEFGYAIFVRRAESKAFAGVPKPEEREETLASHLGTTFYAKWYCEGGEDKEEEGMEDFLHLRYNPTRHARAPTLLAATCTGTVTMPCLSIYIRGINGLQGPKSRRLTHSRGNREGGDFLLPE